MPIIYELSENSYQHIDKLKLAGLPDKVAATIKNIQTTLDINAINFHHLNCLLRCKLDDIEGHSQRLAMSTLQASLIQDISSSLSGYQSEPISLPPKGNTKSLVQFIGVSLAGIIFVACEGFDAVATVMQLIHLPISMILGASCIIAFAAALIFTSFETNDIAKQLGIKRREAMQAINTQLKQVKALKRATTAILFQASKNMSAQDCMDYIALIHLLRKKKLNLENNAKKIHKSLDSKRSKITHVVTSTLEGFIFLSAGFCTAQTVSSVIATFIVGASISLVNPYILAACCAIALISLGFYLCSERISLKRLINKKFGLDRKKIKKFVSQTCDKNNELDHLLDHAENALIQRYDAITAHNKDQKLIKRLNKKLKSRERQKLVTARCYRATDHAEKSASSSPFNQGITHFSSAPSPQARRPLASLMKSASPISSHRGFSVL